MLNRYKMIKISEPVLGAGICLIYGCSHEAYLKVLGKHFKGWKGVEDDFDMYEAFFQGKASCIDMPSGERYYLIWLRDRKDFWGLLHECVHVWQKVAEDRGAETGGELEAYYLEWMVKTLWQGM